MTSSAIPAALDALVALLRAALPDVQVIDGPEVTTVEQDVVLVGTSDEGLGAVWEQSHADLAGGGVDSFDLGLRLGSRSGDNDLRTVRGRVFTLYGAVSAAVAADRRLGGVVAHARISGGSYTGQQVADGVWAEIDVTVRCQAFVQ